jgi:hypothetical protein
MSLITRREAARRLWSLARRLDEQRTLTFPCPVTPDRMTQDEVLLLATALEMGAEALEPVGRVGEEDAFSEFTEGRPGFVMHRPRREGRR